MTHRDIVVIGTSRGGLEALRRLAPRLPANLPAAVLIVMHLSPDSPGYLAEMLNRTGPLPAADARDGEPLRAGRIYVAVPGRHLMVEGDRIRLPSGPRESHARPSVDVLFRSAAFSHGPRVIGIVLTGLLDDGTAGLWSIKDRGGMAIVQSPREAEYPSMPENAKKHVKVDYVVSLAEIPEVLRALTAEEVFQRKANMPGDKLDIENRIALEGDALSTGVRSLGHPSFYTCPECHGSMVAIREGSIKRFRCHTGHGYTADSLLEEALPRIENSLWGALAQLEERQVLLLELEQSAKESDPGLAARYAAEARRMHRLGRSLRELATDPAFTSTLPPKSAAQPERDRSRNPVIQPG